MSLLLKDASLLDEDHATIRRGTFLVGPDGRPEPAEEPVGRLKGQDVLDCRGGIVVPAFGCGHHHAYSALARGMPAPPRPPADFAEILELVWWRLDRALDGPMIEASALVTAMASARAGTTLVIDHHSSPMAARGSLETIATAFDRVGVRHLLCLELSDRDGETAREEGLAETAAYLDSGRPGLVGLHASFTVGDALLGRAVELARRFGTGIHVHVAEDPVDQERTVRACGLRVIERFRQAGVLDLPGTILAHCLHVDETERRTVASSGAWVAQNTESNQANGVGTFDPRGLGDRIMLGTDGMHSDMIRSARAAYLAGQTVERPAPKAILERLRAVDRYASEAGLRPACSDLVVLSYDPPTPVTGANWPAHLLYGVTAADVRHVVIGGRVVVRDGRLTTIDEAAALEFAREQAQRLWNRLSGAPA